MATVYHTGVYEYQSSAAALYYEGNALRRTSYVTENSVFYLLKNHPSTALMASLNCNSASLRHRMEAS